MKGIYGLFESPHLAQSAFEGLRDAGVPPANIVAMSSEPCEQYEFGRQHHRTRMPWIAVSGGAAGLASAYLLTAITQQSWPIGTGGMPIVTNMTNLIIMFELTMLGVVLSTVATFLITAGIPHRLPAIYDPAISEGAILVGVADPDDSITPQVEKILWAARAQAVKTVE